MHYIQLINNVLDFNKTSIGFRQNCLEIENNLLATSKQPLFLRRLPHGSHLNIEYFSSFTQLCEFIKDNGIWRMEYYGYYEKHKQELWAITTKIEFMGFIFIESQLGRIDIGISMKIQEHLRTLIRRIAKETR